MAAEVAAIVRQRRWARLLTRVHCPRVTTTVELARAYGRYGEALLRPSEPK